MKQLEHTTATPPIMRYGLPKTSYPPPSTHARAPAPFPRIPSSRSFVDSDAGDGSQTRSFQYVDDLVRGLIALMNSNYSGPVNIGNPDEYTVKDFAEVGIFCGWVVVAVCFVFLLCRLLLNNSVYFKRSFSGSRSSPSCDRIVITVVRIFILWWCPWVSRLRVQICQE